jgi:hypothetical protein
MLEEYVYIVFKSVHEAMKTEMGLKAGGFIFETIPAPRIIRPDCGIAIRLKKEKQDEVKGYMQSHNLPYAEIVHLTREGK